MVGFGPSSPFTGEKTEATGIGGGQPPTTISREMVFHPQDGERLREETEEADLVLGEGQVFLSVGIRE